MGAERLRIGLIVPRYGPEVGGGAETLARHFAETAVGQGCHVDIWTTCALDHLRWENVLPAGESRENGVHVHRFPITRWPDERHHQLSTQFIREHTLPKALQFAWLDTWVHSERLYDCVASHSADYDLILALPYLSSIVLYAAWQAVDQGARVVIVPCLHDEPAAYITPVRLLMEKAAGVLFLSPEERELAVGKLQLNLPRNLVLGMGVAPPNTPSAPLVVERPYLLTIGRLESGKNLALLCDYMQRYVEEGNPLRLLLIGQGPYRPPDHRAFDFRGFVSEEEKQALLRGALALCHPSRQESFSIVLMESWLAGRPVLVNERCAVTRGHVARSGGGLTFDSYSEFAAALDMLRASPDRAVEMGFKGRDYVEDNYSWPQVWRRFIDWFVDIA